MVDVLSTTCCKNYICYTCALEYIKGKAESPGTASLGYPFPLQPSSAGNSDSHSATVRDASISAQLPSMPCPHCEYSFNICQQVRVQQISKAIPCYYALVLCEWFVLVLPLVVMLAGVLASLPR
jgi:hypothetical protein